jgi:hypothetical protein
MFCERGIVTALPMTLNSICGQVPTETNIEIINFDLTSSRIILFQPGFYALPITISYANPNIHPKCMVQVMVIYIGETTEVTQRCISWWK